MLWFCLLPSHDRASILSTNPVLGQRLCHMQIKASFYSVLPFKCLFMCSLQLTICLTLLKVMLFGPDRNPGDIPRPSLPQTELRNDTSLWLEAAFGDFLYSLDGTAGVRTWVNVGTEERLRMIITKSRQDRELILQLKPLFMRHLLYQLSSPSTLCYLLSLCECIAVDHFLHSCCILGVLSFIILGDVPGIALSPELPWQSHLRLFEYDAGIRSNLLVCLCFQSCEVMAAASVSRPGSAQTTEKSQLILKGNFPPSSTQLVWYGKMKKVHFLFQNIVKCTEDNAIVF